MSEANVAYLNTTPMLTVGADLMFSEKYHSTHISHECKAFKKFKADNAIQAMGFDDETAAMLFRAATGNYPYYAAGPTCSDADNTVFCCLYSRLCQHLDETPRPLSELLEGSYSVVRNGYTCATPELHYAIPGVNTWRDEAIYVANFRKFVKQLAKAGEIKATPIKNCGKVAIYLYSRK